jgi:hypothetical protein
VQQLAATGLVAWDGRAFQPAKPTASTSGAPQVSDLLLADRT